MEERGWDCCDVILVTGDAYIDSPHVGIALIGRVLEDAGWRVGIIAQPDIEGDDIARLGEPRLYWGVSAGCMDSMVANYTAMKKRRQRDDFTPGGQNTRRPDRASIVYTGLIRKHFKPTVPIVLGGLEASLRRVAHFDFWTNKVRRSLIFDAKADALFYGEGERAVRELASRLDAGEYWQDVRGLSCIAKEPPEDYLRLPSFEEVSKDKPAFLDMFGVFYENCSPQTAKGLVQKHAERWLVQNPPQPYLTQPELDAVYALPFARDVHPGHKADGPVRALDTIRFSLTTHRGCYGECNFCAIAVHEGRTVRWRSPESILAEARHFTTMPDFKGIISDAGGPTANMYANECQKKIRQGPCKNKRCLYPEPCKHLELDHRRHVQLLRDLRAIPGVRKVFVASGIRTDLIQADIKHGLEFLDELTAHHVSGQLKLAPEHTEPGVLALMAKPGPRDLLKFKSAFEQSTKKAGKNQFLTYYFIAAHPGCTQQDMQRLQSFTSHHLHINPEQVQIFTPTPSTWSTAMYYTETDPFTRRKIFVEKSPQGRQRQKDTVTGGGRKK